MDLTFRNSKGEEVQRDLVREDRPVILTLNYYRCPMLCSLTLNGLVDGLREMEWSAGDQFDIITVSINPNEGPELAAQNKSATCRATFATPPRRVGISWSEISSRSRRSPIRSDSAIDSTRRPASTPTPPASSS